MSLFQSLTDMSAGYADALDSGQYKFEQPSEPEPAPTVSLYNLLDYPVEQLTHFHTVLNLGLLKLDSIKLAQSDTYMGGCAFARILEAAIKERERRDSEAWAEKTAKEINETVK